MGRPSVREKEMADALKAVKLSPKTRISRIPRSLKKALHKKFRYLLPILQQLAETWGVARALAGECAIVVSAARAHQGHVDFVGDVTLVKTTNKLTCSVDGMTEFYRAMFACVSIAKGDTKGISAKRKLFVEAIKYALDRFADDEWPKNFMARVYSDGGIIPEGRLHGDVAHSFAVRMAANSSKRIVPVGVLTGVGLEQAAD